MSDWPTSPAPLTRDEAIRQWLDAKHAFERAKLAEMTLRLYIFRNGFSEPKEGMNTLALGDGRELKADYKYNYTLDKVAIGPVLDTIEAFGERGKLIAERLVKFSPELSISEYRKICADDAPEEDKRIRKLIDSVLTVKPGTPALEIKEPK